jgi:hypothetical protein
MKFLTIEATKSMNANTGEAWYRADVKVSVDDNEVPEEVFQSLKSRLDGWLPNPFETKSQPQEEKPADRIQAIIDTLNYCTNPNMLQRFAPQVERENNQRLTEAYTNKLKSFI